MKNLLAAVDFSKNTDAVLEQAAFLTQALEGKLWIVHVVSDESPALAYESAPFSGYAADFTSIPGNVQLARDISADEIRQEHTHLLHISARLREEGVDAQALLLKGHAPDLILEKAADLKADIVILGSRGHGLLHKALLGSVNEAVIRHARCSVLIVPGSGHE
jgi:nucleotide-binding universal stress UspA family protein